METIIVALIVGAAGGLFGSIAGPFLSHNLDRGKRREIREEERHRELRRMIEAKMVLVQRLQTACSAVEFMARVTDPLQAASMRDEWLDKLNPGLQETTEVWRPHRLYDQLGAASSHLNGLQSKFLGHLILLRVGPGLQEWVNELHVLDSALEQIIVTIDLEMDRLEW